MKLWAGRTDGEINQKTNDFNSSISFDCAMYREDITGSIAHVTMLGETGIIDKAESLLIADTLKIILDEIDGGTLEIDFGCEDIHSFTEFELTKRLGDPGKRLHTARSRNDQVALDLRLHLLKKSEQIGRLLGDLIETLVVKAEENTQTIMPGYTHLQRAQPITFAHHLLAYANMFLRDMDRLSDCKKRMSVSPLGCGALAGTTYPIDRKMSAGLLGMNDVCYNSLDGVSDRDFVIELLGVISLIMVHLSRFCEEIIMWCSWEFRFITLDDAFSTGSSIMPQKKNPDIAELVRGKSGRVFGSLMGMLTTMKGLSLAYNKDMQEDKEMVFDAVKTVIMCLDTFIPMLETANVNKENMRNAAAKGFINATDCADYLVNKGMPFRDAYKITGAIVAVCSQTNQTLETLPLATYKESSDLFENDIFEAISLDTCVNKRTSLGGPSAVAVEFEINRIKEFLGEKND